ncbi:MAG: hypothetical protein US71_C0008G0002 [Parcubacteria group bacterium GW2011_GWD2_38_12]|nr:MAG: hypothetical protein US71_C0008G0002 [Parcubacteria group bacterium GW2011_GWD2_38_12]
MILIAWISQILIFLTELVIKTIDAFGYFGVALLMALESAAIPIPSEVIMPFSGFLVSQEKMTLLGAALAGALGSVLGSWAIYELARYGGRPLLEKYGKYILISKSHLDSTDRFFQKYGMWATFLGRMLPVFRTYISIPAGLAGIDLKKFLALCFIGSFIWSYFLAWLGVLFGEHWEKIKDYMHYISIAILILVISWISWWFWKNTKKRRNNKQ